MAQAHEEDWTPEQEEEMEPAGTLFLVTVYVMVVFGMWGTMYWLLLSR